MIATCQECDKQICEYVASEGNKRTRIVCKCGGLSYVIRNSRIVLSKITSYKRVDHNGNEVEMYNSRGEENDFFEEIIGVHDV